MSKVICDVCGTTFPETANQCPICGNARNGSAQTAADNGSVQAEAGSAYSYVSGGRFSKANVRKRNKTGEPMQRRSGEPGKKDDGSNGSNKGLVIVVIVLLLAIIAVCIYIGVRFFMPENKPSEPVQQTTTQPSQTQSQEPTGTESIPESTGVACTDIQLSSTIIEFTDMEKSQLLSAVLTPVDTTEKLIFTSLDPEVATVTDGGLVTPVGPGETTITVTCGEIQKECRVVCRSGEATEPTDPEPTEPDVGDFELVFNLNPKFITDKGVGDVTLKVGDTWRLYKTMNVEASKVVWTSDNESVATIKDGVVTVIARPTKAYILVHGEYAGVKYSCRIRVTGAASTPAPTTPPATEPAQNPEGTGDFTMTFNTKYSTSSGDGDVTLHPGDTWKAYKNISISPEQATWTSDDPAVCTVADGVVTVVAVGKTMIHAEYNGVKYSCVINVR